MTTRDYFSKQSSDYAKYRPRYPDSLFAYLASLTSGHECAVDCATGNGQAALGLAAHFTHVIAVDASESQIRDAFPHTRVQYNISRAENLGVPSHSVDIVTVAQALHWFNLDDFYKEVKRVLKTDGILAVWTYNLNEIEPRIDRITRKYHDEIVGPYWPTERHLLADGYRSLPFPFREIQPSEILMETKWGLENLIGYLRSWSATQRCIDETGANPLEQILPELENAWKHSPDEQKLVRWPLSLRIGFDR